MSNGKYQDGVISVGAYDIRTTAEHIAQLESDIARMQQQIADQGMMLAQLREIVQGEPPFLQPKDDWHVNE